MDIVVTLIIGAIMLALVVALVILGDKTAETIGVPLYSRISDKVITWIFGLLLIPMVYGLGSIAQSVMRYIHYAN